MKVNLSGFVRGVLVATICSSPYCQFMNLNTAVDFKYNVYHLCLFDYLINKFFKRLSVKFYVFFITELLMAPNVTITETTIGSATVKWDGVGPKADKFVVSLSPTNTSDPTEKLVRIISFCRSANNE